MITIFLVFIDLSPFPPLGTQSVKIDAGGEVIRPPLKCLVSRLLKFPVKDEYPPS